MCTFEQRRAMARPLPPVREILDAVAAQTA
jgi:hypothetical protein